jgi:acyl-CoA synthetase (AMP-forming)/AMP-acid ligase II
VIGVPHPRWEERPVLIVEAHEGAEIDSERVVEFIRPLVAKWWLPDEVIFATIPLTSTGKIDKKAMRATYGTRLLSSA